MWKRKRKNTDRVISEHYTILDNLPKTAFTSTFINFPNTQKKLKSSSKYDNYNDNWNSQSANQNPPDYNNLEHLKHQMTTVYAYNKQNITVHWYIVHVSFLMWTSL